MKWLQRLIRRRRASTLCCGAAAGDETASISCETYDVEVVNHTSGSTPPAETLRGHPYAKGGSYAIGVSSGDHLWWRIRRTIDDGAAAVGVLTIQTN